MDGNEPKLYRSYQGTEQVKPSIRLDAAETARADAIKEVLAAIGRQECGFMRCTCDDGQKCRTFAILVEKLRKEFGC